MKIIFFLFKRNNLFYIFENKTNSEMNLIENRCNYLVFLRCNTLIKYTR